MAEMEPAKRRRFRYSLRKAAIVLSVVVLALSHALSSYRLFQSEKTLAELRRVTGELVVSDPAKLQVVSLQKLDSLVSSNNGFWRWRIYVPPGHGYDLTIELSDLAQASPGDSSQKTIILSESANPRAGKLAPGEWIVSYRETRTTRQEPLDQLSMTIEAARTGASFSAGRGMPMARLPWMAVDWSKDHKVAGKYETEVFDADQPAALLELRSRPEEDFANPNPNAKPKLRVLLVPRMLTP